MLGLKKLLFWAIILAVGYHGLDFVKVHTSSEVVAYKRFAKALAHNDSYTLRMASNEELATKLLSRNEERTKRYHGARVLFNYYEVVSQNLARDGKSANLIVEQVSRVASNGQAGIWGDREIRIRHTVKLEKKNQLWKVTDFIDPAMR
jgi:hypothetical protein